MTITANASPSPSATTNRQLADALSAPAGGNSSPGVSEQAAAYTMAGLVRDLANAVEAIRDAYAAQPGLVEIEPPESYALEADLDLWLSDIRELEVAWRAKVSMV